MTSINNTIMTEEMLSAAKRGLKVWAETGRMTGTRLYKVLDGLAHSAEALDHAEFKNLFQLHRFPISTINDQE